MMRQFMMISGLLAVCLAGVPLRTAQAGPLLDWLFHRPAYGPPVPVGAPYPVSSGYAPYATGYATLPAAGYPYSTGYTPYGVAYPGVGAATAPTNYNYAAGAAVPSYGTYYGATAPILGSNTYGYLSQRPPNNTIAPTQAVMPPQSQVMPPMVQSPVPLQSPVTLVPDYRSTASRVPVTYYRPVLTTDPNTGAQVVTLAPCSSYEYQTQRVPTWGLSQVFNGGATLPATAAPAPVVSPTYALPRGGVPLAGPMPATQPYASSYGAYPSYPSTAYPNTAYPSNVAPLSAPGGSVITPAAPNGAVPYTSGYPGYAADYGNYSSLQPPVAMPPTGSYSTSPYGASSSAYYGSGLSGSSTGGGSTGSSATGTFTAPGGSAPYSAPPYTAPPAIGGPSSTVPNSYPSVLPPMPSSDPAAGATPSLPPGYPSGARLDAKPQLQNIVQQPVTGLRPSVAPTQPSDSPFPAKTNEGLLPIPVPDNFDHEPRWNPGLLKEKDATAQRSGFHESENAWGSKPIQWASLRRTNSTSELELDELQLPAAGMRSSQIEIIRQVNDDIPAVNFPPIQPALAIAQPAPAAAPVPAPAQLPAAPLPVPAPAAKLRFDLWQAVK